MINNATLQSLSKEQLVALVLASGSMPTGTNETTFCGLKHGARFVQKLADPLLHPDYGFPNRVDGKVGFDTLFEDVMFGSNEAGRQKAEEFAAFVRSGDKNLGQIVIKFQELAPNYLARVATWNNVVEHFLFVSGNVLNDNDLGEYREHELAAYGLPVDHPVTNAADCNAVFQTGDAINRGNAIRQILAQAAAPVVATPAPTALGAEAAEVIKPSQVFVGTEQAEEELQPTSA